MTDFFVGIIIVTVVLGKILPGSSVLKVEIQDRTATNSDCNHWQSLVDKSVEQPRPKFVFDVSREQDVIEGIACLLKLEGNQNPARFGGAMNDGVSKIFIFDGEKKDGSKVFMYTKTEVAALYYVSYLFTRKFDHANAVALKDSQTGNLDSPDIVKKAFKAYSKWFTKVKEIGLEEARKQELDPLAGSGVSWY